MDLRKLSVWRWKFVVLWRVNKGFRLVHSRRTISIFDWKSEQGERTFKHFKKWWEMSERWFSFNFWWIKWLFWKLKLIKAVLTSEVVTTERYLQKCSYIDRTYLATKSCAKPLMPFDCHLNHSRPKYEDLHQAYYCFYPTCNTLFFDTRTTNLLVEDEPTKSVLVFWWFAHENVPNLHSIEFQYEVPFPSR